MSFKTSLKNAKGLGAAKSGVHHWIMVRVTSLALIPLTLWLAYSVIILTGSDISAVQEWLSKPLNSLGLILFLLLSFYHGFLGIQVVIEDYVHKEFSKILLVFIMQILCFAAAAAGTFAVISIYLKG